MITAETRLCTVCRAILPAAPAAPVCDRCGTVHCPPHRQWPLVLKWWLLAELARSLFFPWKSTQQTWEDLLRDALNGIRHGTRPNPNGLHLTMSTPAAELYPVALERAQAWKAEGSRLEPADPARNVA